MEVLNRNPMLDSFSNISFRQFIGNKANEYRLTGYIRRLNTTDMKIVFEGDGADADAFFYFLRDQGGIGQMHSCIYSIATRIRRDSRLNTTFCIDFDEDIDRIKGENGLGTASVSTSSG